MSMVTRLNPPLAQADLHRFLFSQGRQPPRKLHRGLHGAQAGRCFFCRRPIQTGVIEHFLPFAHSADDGLDNLTVACRQCNRSKSDHLASSRHVQRWVKRIAGNLGPTSILSQLAETHSWEKRPGRTTGLAMSLYDAMGNGGLLWDKHPDLFREIAQERQDIDAALASIPISSS